MTLEERLDQVRYLVELRSRLEKEIHVQEDPLREIAVKYWDGYASLRGRSNRCWCGEMELVVGTKTGGSPDVYFEWWCDTCGVSEGFYVPVDWFTGLS